ncbi:MAG: exosortase-associated EpsI family protein, partial [Planctomycetota bacterium]
EEILRSLGTSDYIQWVLEDPREPADSPIRRVMLFITYYALPDQVPHVPEECYTGGGYQRVATEAVRLSVDGPAEGREVPARYLVFEASGTALPLGVRRFPVLYLFRVNEEYAGSRDRARIALNRNIFSPYAYFCKVELVFNQTHATPTKAQATEAGERLLTLVLPVLEQGHWPEGVQP